MNLNMWVKALQVIPRLEKDEWDQLDIISRWLISTRAAVLIMTFISAAIAGLLAIRDGGFSWWRWLLVVIGLTFAHATNNLLNDLTDYRRGVDTDNYYRTLYGPQPVQQGLISEKGLLGYAAASGLIALAAGIPLVITSGWLGLALLLAGAFFVLFYTWPLKYIGLGEIAVILVWGPLMVGGGYSVITGVWDWNVALFSLVYALGPTTVIFGKHIDKIDADRAKMIRTLPVLLGEKHARYTALGMMVLQYLLVVYLVVIGFITPWLLIVFFSLLTIPRVARMFIKPKPVKRPAEYDETIWPLWFSAGAFFHNRIFGLLFLAGLILELLI